MGTLVAFGLIPALLVAAFLGHAFKPGTHEMVDLQDTYLPAAHSYLHQHTPYPTPGWLAAHPAHAFYCPPQMAALFVPLALLPFHIAAIVFALLAAAAVPAALWLLDVRDPRVYGAAALSPAILTAVSVGTSSTFLLLAGAAAWRWRDRTAAVVTAVGIAVGTKLFLWPLVAWLWFSGRRIAAAASAAAMAAVTIVAWSWLGFADLTSFPALLRRASDVDATLGYAPLGHLGGAAFDVASIVGVFAVCLACRRGDDLGYLAAIAVALLATPSLWLHYLALLALMAVRAPRLGIVWIAPLLFWITPRQLADGEAWRVGIALGVGALVGLAAVRSRSEPEVDGLAATA